MKISLIYLNWGEEEHKKKKNEKNFPIRIVFFQKPQNFSLDKEETDYIIAK